MNAYIKVLKYDDIEEFSKFASEIFIDYYSPINGSKHANYMARKFLSNQAITNLVNNGAIFKIIYLNNIKVGFTEYLYEQDRIFLSKLYIHKDYRHKGLGKVLFNEITKALTISDRKAIYLTVNKHNTPSIEIYKHLGFTIIDSVETDIGNNYIMDDYIMEFKKSL